MKDARISDANRKEPNAKDYPKKQSHIILTQMNMTQL